MTDSGFNGNLYAQLTRERLQDLAAKQGGWFPPDGVHTVELVGVDHGKTRKETPYFGITWRVALGESKHLDKTFRCVWYPSSRKSDKEPGNEGMVAKILNQLYDGEGPETIAMALETLEQLAGNYYEIALKRNNPDYAPNCYVNRALGPAEEVEVLSNPDAPSGEGATA